MANLLTGTTARSGAILDPRFVGDLSTILAPPLSADEFGVTGGLLFRNFLTGETISTIPISYSELQRLTQQDGQARAILNLVTTPLRVADWDVYTPEEDDVRFKLHK